MHTGADIQTSTDRTREMRNDALIILTNAGGDQIGRVIDRLGDASSNDDGANRYV